MDIVAVVTRHEQQSIPLLQTWLSHFSNDTHTLEVAHLLLKHGRACNASSPQQCAAHFLYDQLCEHIMNNVQVGTAPSYPLLVCLVDLAKHGSLPEQTYHTLLQVVCPLWTHNKIYLCRKSMELCYRIVPEVGDSPLLLETIIHYIQHCRQNLSRSDLDKFKSPEYTEFFYDNASKITFDRSTLRWLIQIVLSLFTNSENDGILIYDALIVKIKDLYDAYCASFDFIEALFAICCANDDDTVQLMDQVLAIYQQPSSSHYARLLSSIRIDPHILFLYFLVQCGSTHDILVDLLLEDDSGFLSYFHRYVIYATRAMDAFKEAMDLLDVDVDTMHTVIAHLMLVLEGDGFPYNTKPLVRRLLVFEQELLRQ